MRTLLILLLLPVGAWLLLCILLFASQRSFIYYPVPESKPAGAQSIRLRSGDADLKIWVVPRAGPRAILYFGGNGEDVAFNLAGFASAFPGHSLYLVNYRGYGGSSGAPTEAGLEADAVAAFDHLRKTHAEISVIGRSLGSGVATYLASVRPVHRLVLVTPFDSLVNVARGQMKLFPVVLLLRDRFESADAGAGDQGPHAARGRRRRSPDCARTQRCAGGRIHGRTGADGPDRGRRPQRDRFTAAIS